jgi:hypothetical protein
VATPDYPPHENRGVNQNFFALNHKVGPTQPVDSMQHSHAVYLLFMFGNQEPGVQLITAPAALDFAKCR